MNCYIYRCSARADMYLYLRAKDDFACLPDELAKRLGRLDFAMQLEISADRKLAKEDPVIVKANLHKQGFHLQMPGDIALDELMQGIAESQNRAALASRDKSS